MLRMSIIVNSKDIPSKDDNVFGPELALLHIKKDRITVKGTVGIRLHDKVEELRILTNLLGLLGSTPKLFSYTTLCSTNMQILGSA